VKAKTPKEGGRVMKTTKSKKLVLHLANSMDGNDTITFTVRIPKGSTKQDEQVLALTAALEAAGWDGPFDGAGIDAQEAAQ
jgi:hypothetical protein